MEKKLYRVKIVLFVMGENESDAAFAATQAPFEIFDCVARKAEKVDPEWMDAVPYNSEDDRTCSEILNNRPVYPRFRTSILVLPAYSETNSEVFNRESQPAQVEQQVSAD